MRRESAAISPVSEVIAAIRDGEIVILVDDEDRENEGDLVFGAEFVTPEKINFLAKHGRGLICMPVTEEHAARLGLRPMVEQNRSRHGTNFTVSIEAAEGIATGISAHDRALTIKAAGVTPRSILAGSDGDPATTSTCPPNVGQTSGPGLPITRSVKRSPLIFPLLIDQPRKPCPALFVIVTSASLTSRSNSRGHKSRP